MLASNISGETALKKLRYRQWLARLLDYFIPASLKRDIDRHTRSQILVGVILFNVAMSILTACFVHFWMDLKPSNALLAYAVIGQCVAIYFAALIVLRASGSFLIAGNVAAFAVFITVLCSVIVTGGYRDSPFTQMFVLVPVLGFLSIGWRSGIAWSATTTATLFGLLFMDQVLDFHYQLLHKRDTMAFRQYLPFIMILMIAFTLIVYEFMNRSLKKQLSRERNRFAFKASHDSLTDLPNRSEFYVRLRRGLEEVQISDSSLALIYLDLDGFKPINDNHGHHAGDKVLKVLASRLRGIVRQQDTVARLGGDEFALVLTGVKKLSDVEHIAAKTLTVISEPIEIDGKIVIVHGSAGIALCPQHTSDSDQLCRLADLAMYKAKEVKNTYRFSEAAQGSPEVSAV